MNLRHILIESAHQEGFPIAGVVDIDLAKNEFQKHAEKYNF